jgi:hypothetical protein
MLFRLQNVITFTLDKGLKESVFSILSANSVCWPLDPKVAGLKPGQGDGILMAIKIRSTPSSRMGSKTGRSHVVRFYSM